MTTYIKTVDPNGGADYLSIAAWEAGEQTLYVATDIAIADCLRTGSSKDTTPVNVSGWTAGVIPKIVVNAAYRHEGKWADTRVSNGNYIYQLIISVAAHCVNLNVENAVCDGLSVELIGTTGALIGIYNNGTRSIEVSNNVLRAPSFTGIAARGIYIGNSPSQARAYNNVVHDWKTQGIFVTATVAGNGLIYNNTVFNCGFAIASYIANSAVAINNVSMENANLDFDGTFHSSSDKNVSSDATAPGATTAKNKTDYAMYFVDHVNRDFHTRGHSDALWGISGNNLSGAFTTDFEGDTRSVWDVGADEFVVGGAPPSQIARPLISNIVSNLARSL